MLVRRVWISWAILGSLVIAACSEQASPPSIPNADVVNEPGSVISDQGHAGAAASVTPLRTESNVSKLPLVSDIKFAPSWRVRVDELDAVDRAYLAAVSRRYLGSVEFESKAEQQRLIEQGFPMPEEWLAARDMSDMQLKSLAESGNLKAQMFLVDRMSEQLAPIQAARRQGVEPPIPEVEIVRQFAASTQLAEHLIAHSDTPFAAYVYGRALASGTWGSPPEPMAAALFMAKDRGDYRASSYIESFNRAHPNMDTAYILALYSGMKSLQRPPDGT